MNHDIALQWVIDHESTIRKFAGRYIKRTPYGYEDFISSARVAAILASNKVQGNAELFNKAFWTCYQNVLSEFSPNPFTKSKRSNCSMSIPTDLCDYPDEWSYIDDNTGGQDLDEHIEEIFNKIKPLLKPPKRRLLCSLLGLDKKGKLTPAEAALVMGCTRQSVTKFVSNLCITIEEQVENGTLDFKYLLDNSP